METQIFYFSGTGNSLRTARKIQEKLPNSTLTPLITVKQQLDVYTVTAKTVIFVFPAYFYQMPAIVKTLLKKLAFLGDAQIFGVVTSGGDAGNALYEFDRTLQSKGHRLNMGIEVPLGDNSIVLHTPEEKITQRFEHMDALLDPLIRAIKTGGCQEPQKEYHKRLDASIQKNFIYWTMAHYYRFKHQRIDAAQCTRCGVCVDVCPVNNIHVQEGKMVFSQHCAWCFACINDCPSQAISFGKIHPQKEEQYRASGVKAKEIAAQKETSF